MIEASELKKLMDVAQQSLETNKSLLVDIKYHQELVCAMADWLVKLSRTPNMPVDALVEISSMSRKLVNFQMVFTEKMKKDLAWS